MVRDMRVLLTGATGFVGRRLAVCLETAGHSVVAMTRSPEKYDGPGEARHGDVDEPESLPAALEGCDAAYYLVHSLDSKNFVELDAKGARDFAAAAAQAHLQRIVYLGGLGKDSDDLSDHLRSRHEVEGLLRESGVPVTVLRAGIVIGDEGASWEMTRDLVRHLPVMVTPKWVKTRTQPISLDDVVAYLCSVIDMPEAADKTYEVGGPDVLSYADMLIRTAKLLNRTIAIFPTPFLTPGLSKRWLGFVTSVDNQTAASLVESMTNEVVVTDDSITRLVPRDLMTFEQAARVAIDERAAREAGATKGGPQRANA